MIRALSSTLFSRANFANWAGITFQGARNMFRVLGYDRVLTPRMYRWRYDRGGIVARLVEAKPQSTWREGGTLIEDEDPDTETPFEKAWIDLDQRLRIWPLFEQSDVLAGLGRYSVIFIGAAGEVSTPLQRVTGPDGILYLSAFSERDVLVEALETNTASPRFGQPTMYNFQRMTAPLTNGVAAMRGRVHYSRVIHIADGKLDDHMFGQPRLERIWNLLDDLDKVVGGGAEAFWKRVDAGMHLKLDPNIKDMSTEDKAKLDEQLDEYVDGLRRILKTRGIEIDTLSAQTAGIRDPVTTIVSLISAATSIPQRILLGSERGELASSQDRDEWGERIADRRVAFAGPMVVRPFVDRLIELGALPKPEKYEARWPAMKALDELQKVSVAKELAQMNQFQGEQVVTTNEIRDRYLDLPPIEEVLTPEELAARTAPPPPPAIPGQPGAVPPKPPKAIPTAARRANKWRHLTIAEKHRYLMRVAAVRKAAQSLPVSTPEERALTGAIAHALSKDDQVMAERLIINALRRQTLTIAS